MPFLILLFAISSIAQELAPMWIQDSWRSAHYPSTEWYTGFAKDKAKGSPNKERFKDIEKNAQNSLSESITVHIQGNSSVEKALSQKQSGKDHSETTNTYYKQTIASASNAVLAKMETYSYFDKESGYIYGFSAVRKKDLADFYRSKITGLFSYAEKELSIAEQLAESGKKSAALDKIQAVEDSLKSVSFWGSLLQAVVSDNSHTAQEMALWQRANNAKMQFQNGTALYLDISGNEDYSDLEEQLGAQMQEMGCNCTIAEDNKNAEYLITIKTKLSRCNENSYGEVYCYANANVTVNNPKFKKPVNVKIPEAKGGWTNGNKDKATEEAFKELTNSMAEKIIQTINQ